MFQRPDLHNKKKDINKQDQPPQWFQRYHNHFKAKEVKIFFFRVAPEDFVKKKWLSVFVHRAFITLPNEQDVHCKLVEASA